MSDSFFKVSRGLQLTPQASVPSNPVNGDQYYDSTRGTLVQYINGKWRDVQSRSDLASASSITSSGFSAVVVQSSVVKLTGSTTGSIHGAAAGADAKHVIVYNATNTTQTLKHQSTTETTAANRIISSTGGDIVMAAGESAVMFYDSTQSRWIASPASGSGDGTGVKNLLTALNSKFEGGIQDWITYDDGAVAIPVDGTGGSPAALTITTTTSAGEILEGLKTLKISKSAADAQGEGTSVLTKAVDRGDRGRPMFISMTVDSTSTNYVSGDLKLYAYDVTNSKLLTVYSDFNNGGVIKGKGRVTGMIFTEDTTASIRLMAHVTTTNALAWDVFVDEVVVTPQANVNAGITFANYRLSGSSSRGATDTFVVKFDTVQETFDPNNCLSLTNTTANGTYVTVLRAGVISVSASLQRSASNETYISKNQAVLTAIPAPGTENVAELDWNINSAGKHNIKWSGYVMPGDKIRVITETNPVSDTENTVTFSFVANSPSLMSQNDVGLQTVRFVGTQVSQSVTGGVTNIAFTANKDPYGAWNGTTFTAPRAGEYLINYSVNKSGSGTITIYKNGAITTYATSNTGSPNSHAGVAILTLAKDDTITLRCDTSPTITNSLLSIVAIPDFNTFGVQGPVVVGMTTDWISVPGGNVIEATTTAPTKATAPLVDEVYYRRVGDSMEVRMYYRQTAATGAAAGSGDYLWKIPGGFQIDTNKVNPIGATGIPRNSAVGHGVARVAANTHDIGTVAVYDATRVSMTVLAGGTTPAISIFNIGSASHQITNAVAEYGLFFTVPIVAWSAETRLYPTQRVIGTTYLKDVKASGTASGALTANSYITRVLNTQEGDTGFCSLGSNQFTLQPGTYELDGVTFGLTGAAGTTFKSKIVNITDTTDAILSNGTRDSNPALDGSSDTQTMLMKGRINIATAKVFELQTRCNSTSSGGSTVTFGDSEVFSMIKIEKIY